MEQEYSNSARKILIADDDLRSRKLIKQILINLGYEMIEAINGLEAIEKFVQDQPHLVILDASMNKMNGFDACRQIKKLSGDRKIPIAMVSAYADEESIKKGYEAGVTDYITKPINLNDFTGRIRFLLRARYTKVSQDITSNKYTGDILKTN